MKIDDEVSAALLGARSPDEPWLQQASSREDRIAEAVAVIALVFAIGVGLVIALLPVTVRATSVDLVRPAAAAPAPASGAPGAWNPADPQ